MNGEQHSLLYSNPAIARFQVGDYGYFRRSNVRARSLRDAGRICRGFSSQCPANSRSLSACWYALSGQHFADPKVTLVKSVMSMKFVNALCAWNRVRFSGVPHWCLVLDSGALALPGNGIGSVDERRDHFCLLLLFSALSLILAIVFPFLFWQERFFAIAVPPEVQPHLGLQDHY